MASIGEIENIEKFPAGKFEIKLFKPINKKKEIIGILEQINEKAIIVISDNEEQEILRQDIAQIKKVYEW